MPDTIQKLRNWSYRRQCLGGQGGDATQVLGAVIAVYSAHPSAPLSLAGRMSSFREKDLYRLDEDRTALRIPAMRLSVHLVPKETAHLVFAATIPPASDSYWEKRYSGKGRGVPTEKYPVWADTILQVTATPLTAAEVREQTDIPDALLKPILNRMAFEGRLLRVGARSLRSNIIRYVATEAWLGKSLAAVGQDEALAWLAGEYLRAFGPVRVKDFQWWAGVTATRAKKAMAAHDTVDIGNGLLLPARDVDDFERCKAPAKDAIDILPQWDCYTMGYAPDGRERFVSAGVQPHLYGKLGATHGNALGAVLTGGLVCGVWTSRFAGSRLNVTLRLFDSPSAALRKKIAAEFEDIAALLQAKSLVLEN